MLLSLNLKIMINEEQKIPARDHEKTTEGGEYNSGVTSGNPEERESIEKEGGLREPQPHAGNDEPQPGEGLTPEDLPDSTNESTGVPGTGQRQDSN